jgi:hypothetical protein
MSDSGEMTLHILEVCKMYETLWYVESEMNRNRNARDKRMEILLDYFMPSMHTTLKSNMYIYYPTLDRF